MHMLFQEILSMCMLFQDILLVNLREEPVVFVADGFDMVAYSPRHQDQLGECYRPTGYSPITNTTDIEVQIRKEVILLHETMLINESLSFNGNFLFSSTLEPNFIFSLFS